MNVVNRQPRFWLLLLLSALMLTACSSRSLNRAPVEDRGTRSAAAASAPDAVPAVAPVVVEAMPVKQPQGFENAGKPGYYTVKPGDTLLRIALENGQGMKDIARWSQVDNPNHIEVGQVLRVMPPLANEVQVKPVSKPSVTAATAIAPATGAVTSAVVVPDTAASATSAASASSAASPASAASAVVAVAKVPSGEGDIAWIWPANGVVLAGFDDVKNKGVDIGGKAGEPVLAAADGRVVYVGAGLRTYGNLIILKHNNLYLTAYAHNQTLLVKEDQNVLKGQKIAEMGSSDTDKVKLHFELRREGKPVDPIKYLPAR